MLRFTYAIKLTPDRKDGGYVVTCRDIPEAIALGETAHHAAGEGRSLSDLIQDGLEKYLTTGFPEPAHREAAFQLSCERPIKLSPGRFKAVIEHDSWDSWGQ
jgi:predicted RNase H-like HicB family nuclease